MVKQFYGYKRTEQKSKVYFQKTLSPLLNFSEKALGASCKKYKDKARFDGLFVYFVQNDVGQRGPEIRLRIIIQKCILQN